MVLAAKCTKTQWSRITAVVATELPLPTNLTWGVSFRPTHRWEFAVDVQYVLWSAYRELSVSITDPVTHESVYDLPNSIKNYKNTVAVRIGGQYHINKYLTGRMGMYVDESPVRSDFLNPETPSMTKISYTAGLTINPCKNFSIDLAYGYITSADPERTGSTPYYNTLTYKAVYAQTYGQLIAGGMGTEQAAAQAHTTADREATESFSGNYSVSAHTFAIGFNLKF